jgi:hypothetical protein
MIRIENIEVYGFGHALRNMRNPKESWSRSDSGLMEDCILPGWAMFGIEAPELPAIGPNDRKLITDLTRAGSEHRKVLRTIEIWIDIVPWRGMWQEVDTYKIATVRNSCSTMHKLGYRDLTAADFQDEDVDPIFLNRLNDLGEKYRKDRSPETLMALKHRLPEGFLQRAGYHFDYETAMLIFFQRRYHRVPEWKHHGTTSAEAARAGRWDSFCDMIYQLPFMAELLQADTRWRGVQAILERVREFRETWKGARAGGTVDPVEATLFIQLGELLEGKW